jgi:hypothetical protein
MYPFSYDCRKQLKLPVCTLFIIAALVGNFLMPGMGATAGNDLELSVKSAYIYNFLQFIDWQEDDREAMNRPIKICMLGSDPLGDALLELSNRRVKGRSIQVDRHAGETGGLDGYHIIVIGRSVEKMLPDILKQLADANVLTVSDIKDFTRKGGGIGLVTVNGKVKIEINSRVTLQAGLKVSAKLLEVASIVQ